MHTNETWGLWPTLPNGLGCEFNYSGTKEKTTHFLALSAALPLGFGCQGMVSEPRAWWMARFPQASGPAQGEDAIPNLEERWRHGSASPTHRRPSSSYAAPAAARRRPGCCSSTMTSVIFFFFFKLRERYRCRFLSPPKSTPMEDLDPPKALAAAY